MVFPFTDLLKVGSIFVGKTVVFAPTSRCLHSCSSRVNLCAPCSSVCFHVSLRVTWLVLRPMHSPLQGKGYDTSRKSNSRLFKEKKNSPNSEGHQSRGRQLLSKPRKQMLMRRHQNLERTLRNKFNSAINYLRRCLLCNEDLFEYVINLPRLTFKL